jgi:hypothetical protein
MAGIKIKISTEEAQTATRKLYADLEKLGATTKLTTMEVDKLRQRMLDKMGADKAVDAVDRLAKSVGMTRSEVAKFNQTLAPANFSDRITAGYKSIKSHWMAISVAAAAAGIAISKALDYSVQGAKAKQAEESFRQVATAANESADKIISAMKRASAGTIDDSDLMQKAVKGMVLGFSGDQIIKLTEIARVSARVAGEDVRDAYENITDAISTNMPRALKRYGLITKEEMSLVTKAAAAGIEDVNLYSLVTARAALQSAKMGPAVANAAEKLQVFHAQISETKETMGIWINTGLQKAYGVLQGFAAAGLSAAGGIAMIITKIHELNLFIEEHTGKNEKAIAAAKKLAAESRGTADMLLGAAGDLLGKAAKNIENLEKAAGKSDAAAIKRAQADLDRWTKEANAKLASEKAKQKATAETEAAEKKLAEAIKSSALEAEQVGGLSAAEKEMAKMEAEVKEFRANKLKEKDIAQYIENEIVLIGKLGAEEREKNETAQLEKEKAGLKEYEKMVLEETDFAVTENERAINEIIAKATMKDLVLKDLLKKKFITEEQYAKLSIKIEENKNKATLEKTTENAKRIADLNADLLSKDKNNGDKLYELRLKQIDAQAAAYKKDGASFEAIEAYKKDALSKANLEMGENTNKFFVGVQAGLEQLKLEHVTWGKVASDSVTTFAHDAQQEMSDGFFNVMTGRFGEFELEWRDLWDGVARVMSNKLSQMVVKFIAAQATMANASAAVDWVTALFAAKGIWELKGPEEGIPVVAHPGEMIVPAEVADQIRNGMYGSGYGTQFEGLSEALGNTAMGGGSMGRVGQSFLSGTAQQYGKTAAIGLGMNVSGKISTSQLMSGLLSPQALLSSIIGGGIPAAASSYLGLDSKSKIGYGIGSIAASQALGGMAGTVLGPIGGLVAMYLVEKAMDAMDMRTQEAVKDVYEDRYGQYFGGGIQYGADMAKGYLTDAQWGDMQSAMEAALNASSMIGDLSGVRSKGEGGFGQTGWGYGDYGGGMGWNEATGEWGGGGGYSSGYDFGGSYGSQGGATFGGYGFDVDQGLGLEGFASGGEYEGSTPFWAGEKGAEIIFPREKRVLSHAQSVAYAKRAGRSFPGYASGTPVLTDYADEASYNIAVQQRNLDIELMEASGDALGALAARRQDELAAMDESLRATAQAIYDQVDANTAKEKAAALETQKTNLEIELMELQGDAAGALALRRTKELEAMDGSLKGLAQSIFEQTDLNKVNEKAASIEAQRRSLEIELMDASGDSAGVLAARRADELKELEELNPELAILKQRTYDAADAITAQNEAEDLNNRLLTAQGETLKILANEREKESAAATEAGKAILKQIYAQEDLNAVTAKSAEWSSRLAQMTMTEDEYKIYTIDQTYQDMLDEISKLANLSEEDNAKLIGIATDIRDTSKEQLEADKQKETYTIWSSIQSLQKELDAMTVGSTTTTSAAQKALLEKYTNLQTQSQSVWGPELNRVQALFSSLPREEYDVMINNTWVAFQKMNSQIWALYDAELAAAKATDELNQRIEEYQYQIPLLEALGYAEEALAIKRHQELDALSKTNQVLQLQTWAAEDLTEAIGGFETRAEEISTFIDNLSQGSLAPVQSAQSWVNEYAKKRAKALGAGASDEDITGYLSYVQEYLEFQRAYGSNYQELYSSVMSDVVGLQSSNDTALAIAESQLGVLKEQSEILIEYGGQQVSLLESLINAVLTGSALPAHAGGGLTHGLTISGEMGAEWNIPTYEPQRTNFFKTVGFDSETIVKAIAKAVASNSQNQTGDLIIPVVLDGDMIGKVVAKQFRVNPDLQKSAKRAMK